MKFSIGFGLLIAQVRYWLLIPCISLFPMMVSALTITGNVDKHSGVIAWDTFNKPVLLPTHPEVYTGLSTTRKWIPGASPQNVSMELEGPNGTKVNAAFRLLGLSYSVDNSFSKNNDLDLTYPKCQYSVRSSDGNYQIYSNEGSTECIAPFSLNSDLSTQPFIFLKPIIQFDEDRFKTEVKDKAIGSYVGTTSVTFKYYYYSEIGILTYRVLTLPISFLMNVIEIDNIDSVSINNVSPGGSGSTGFITPEYTRSTQTVRGIPTQFDIQVDGHFSSGITMQFSSNTVGEYSMKHLDVANNDSKILYDINCISGCTQTEIVTKGVAKTEGSVKVPKQTDPKQIKLSLNVGYTEQEFNSVVTGKYAGAFTIIFEAGI